MQCYELCLMLEYMYRKMRKLAPDLVRDNILLSDIMHDAGISKLKSLLELDKAQLEQLIHPRIPRHIRAA